MRCGSRVLYVGDLTYFVTAWQEWEVGTIEIDNWAI
jgi:hypothetical protein